MTSLVIYVKSEQVSSWTWQTLLDLFECMSTECVEVRFSNRSIQQSKGK
ncbi:MAG: hypothetical protein ACI9LX_002879 [Paraglaciecola sp.]|jgi:hypothetical protein